MKLSLDKKIAIPLLVISGGIMIYWLVGVFIWLVSWLEHLGAYNPHWWGLLGTFLYRNISILIVMYVILCLQSAGIAEFRYRKNFLKAFLFSMIMTPLGMLFFWGRHKLKFQQTVQGGNRA
jgi:hypothetical protein